MGRTAVLFFSLHVNQHLRGRWVEGREPSEEGSAVGHPVTGEGGLISVEKGGQFLNSF